MTHKFGMSSEIHAFESSEINYSLNFTYDDSVSYGSEFGGLGSVYPKFMLDCKVGWQEWIVLGFDIIIFTINLTLVIYFSVILKDNSGKLN